MGKQRVDQELVERVKRGDKKAFDVLVLKYQHKIIKLISRYVRDQDEVQDVAQEAFIKAYRKIGSYDSEKPFSPWFYKLLKNLCIDHYKRRRRLNEIPLGDIQVLSCDKEDREMKEVLWKGIAELPIDQREVIILRYFRQLSYQEMAEVLGKPIGTIMSSLYYAKKKLKGIVGIYLGFE